MPKYNANDPELQQRVGKWVIIVGGLLAVLLLSRCLAKSPEEKLAACFVKEMRGQTEDMRQSVLYHCKLKTDYKGKIS